MIYVNTRSLGIWQECTIENRCFISVHRILTQNMDIS